MSILAAIFLYCSLLDMVSHLLGISIDEKPYGIPGEAVCALFVNHDIYLLHKRNGTMWPGLKAFDNWLSVSILTIASLSLVLVCAFKLEPEI